MHKLHRFLALASILRRHPRYAKHLLHKKLTEHLIYRGLKGAAAASVVPQRPCGYDLMLTLRCNLRCRMCMQWGANGWCRGMPDDCVSHEMPFEVLEKIVRGGQGASPYFILFGGEPLLYSRLKDLLRLCQRQKSFCYICTNGTLLDSSLEFMRHNPYIALTVSLDGLENENDAIRGAGTFQRVTRNIRELKRHAPGIYVGIEFTVLAENVAVMHQFCKEMVGLGIDWIVLNLRWCISQAQASAYQALLSGHFGAQPRSQAGYLGDYDLDRSRFKEQFAGIRNARWPVQISWMPPMARADDIDLYIDRPEFSFGREFCFKHWLRMDVLPSGEVVACKQFPDLVLGDLRTQTVDEIWHSEEYGKLRQLLSSRLLPVCSRCNALYLYDRQRVLL